MYANFAAVLVFIAIGSAFVFGNLLIGSLVRPRNPNPEKMTAYECGEPTIGPAWVRFNSRFYNVALIYLLFDVEVVVLVPVAMVLRNLAGSPAGMTALVGLLVFLGLLTLGLVYEWFWGNLDWIRRDEDEVRHEIHTDLTKPADSDSRSAQ